MVTMKCQHNPVHHVAQALKLFDYPIASVFEAFKGRARVADPEIIRWLGNQHRHGVWIHADNKAAQARDYQ
jgi:hypothetical protein